MTPIGLVVPVHVVQSSGPTVPLNLRRYIVLCISVVLEVRDVTSMLRFPSPRTVLDVSLLTKTSHECRSYIVVCMSGVVKRVALL